MRTLSRRALVQAGAPLDRALRRWPTLRQFGPVFRFGLVGLSGVAVNSAVLWALVAAGLTVPIASMGATEAAVVSNFLLNDRWTFADCATPLPRWQRFLRFNGVALGGMLLAAALLTALTTYGRVPLLLANLLAVGARLAWNYTINTRLTWRAPGEPRGE
ncbi:MAG TPA: GtrA family protein [Roseiflexaceae bacterium]|nr:GtrA family protein [Roseiflexaceae bacterium]